ncbi:cytochrome ubiquinol oxidase subunit I [Streptomyces flaveolus]|uniref:cytochrome ubiquinol oxidase subunit I n=1 Tax=Streptomyces flaveolus TaxID=67297 RepID=UPI0034085F7B
MGAREVLATGVWFASLAGLRPRCKRTRGRRDAHHKAGFAIPFAVGAVVAPFQIVVGDWAARFLADYQPVKLAATEGAYRTGSHVPLFSIGGVAG